MRIFATHCKEAKALWFSVKAIFGINTTHALKLCALTGVNPRVKLTHLKSSHLERLNRICRDQLPTDLNRIAKDHIKFYINLKHVKGVRHMFALPARGQRTRTNASTAKRLSFIKKNNNRKLTTSKQGRNPKLTISKQGRHQKVK